MNWSGNEKMSKKKIRTVPRWLLWMSSLSALLLLSSCGCDPEVRVVTETQTVVEQVEVTKPLPDNLTDPIPYPAALGDRFTVDDLIDQVFALYDLLDQANRDRADAAELTQPSDASGVPQ